MVNDTLLGVLGGGFSGLSIAYLYTGKSEVLEAEDTVGGHCRSHIKNGFRFDEGAHILFSRDDALLHRMISILGDNVNRHFRNVRIYYKNKFIKYPLENALGELDKEDNYECLINYLNNDYPPPTNFEEWIYYTFGKGIADIYLIPYNRKIWKTDLTEMTIDWAGARVPRPPKEDIVKSSLGINTEGYTHQLYFYYPKRGGIQALPNALLSLTSTKSKIRTGFRIEHINRASDGWSVSDGKKTYYYQKLVSSIPVQELLKCLKNVPIDIKEAATKLHYNSSIFVMLGLSDCRAKDMVTAYFPDISLPFHRVGFPHSYDPDCVPNGKFVAAAEVSCPVNGSYWKEKSENILQMVIDGLTREKFFSKSDILTTDIVREPYSYVVYDKNHQKNINTVLNYIRSLGIEPLGRFGEFEYWNMDQCFGRAEQIAQKLNRQINEIK